MASSPITIVSVARWVVSGNVQAHTVGIYNIDGTPLATVSINTSLGTPGTFEYVALTTPITLAPGQQCVIATQEFSTGDLVYDRLNCSITTTVDAVLGQTAFVADGGSGPAGPFNFAGAPPQAFGPTDFKYHL